MTKVDPDLKKYKAQEGDLIETNATPEEIEIITPKEKPKKVKEEPVLEYDEDDEITKDFIEEEVVEQKEKQGKTYNDIIEDMPELKEDLDYILIVNKIKDGKKVSQKELNFKALYEEAKQKEQAFEEANAKKMEIEEAKQQALQEQVNKEYDEYKINHPEKIEVVDDTKSFSLNNGSNFLKIALTWTKLMKSKKKGGKIFVKVARGKKVSFEWTNKDIHFVEFWSTNTRGDRVKEITRVSQHNYSFNGTSVPVIFAIQGFFESWDFYSEFKKDLSAEYVSGVVMEAYNLGYKDGLILNEKGAKQNKLVELMPLMVVAILVIMGIVAYLCYSIYEDNTQILNALEVIKNTAQAGVQVVG